MKNIKRIEDYQLEELARERLYINKYSLDLMYSYELNRYWKEFFFDILNEVSAKHSGVVMFDNLFEKMKKNYYNIITKYDLKIDIKDYIEISDYISLEEWLKIEGNKIIFYEDKILLAGNIGA